MTTGFSELTAILSKDGARIELHYFMNLFLPRCKRYMRSPRSGDAHSQSKPPLAQDFLHNHYRTRGHHARLPLHLVGLVAVPEAEGAGEIAAKEGLLLDGGQDGLVDGLLVAGTSAGNLLLLL
jgi:hypothetical protein